MQIRLNNREPLDAIREMGAYEALWDQKGASFSRLAKKFKECSDSLPSSFVDSDVIERYSDSTLEIVERKKIKNLGIKVNKAPEYPLKLRDAKHPVELLYYQGWWDLVHSPSVSVVGSRNASPEGLLRAKKLTTLLVEDEVTIISGLAVGIDTIAHRTAILNGGSTIGVLGTPLTHSYPKQNTKLQELIEKRFLLISQVPFIRYSQQSPSGNRFFFPERNKVMSALSKATVIIEAGETSGTLTQAQAALEQGRKLFILDSCFLNSKISWPEKLQEKGAIRVREYQQIKEHLDL